MGNRSPTPAAVSSAAAAVGSLRDQVFRVIADRLFERAEAMALFAETRRSFEDWCTWEVLAACRRTGWSVQPMPGYAEIGVAGSRDHGDLLVFDPATGHRAMVELTIIHDWSTNKWVATLDSDTDKLSRAASVGVAGLQVIAAVSLASPIEVNSQWTSWLGLSRTWNRPSVLRREARLGPVGQVLVRGWEAGVQ